MAAEDVLRDAGIEAIGGEIVTAAQQFELTGRAFPRSRAVRRSSGQAIILGKLGSHRGARQTKFA
jgi:hypothetical protein